jgi:hypothetical protein
LIEKTRQRNQVTSWEFWLGGKGWDLSFAVVRGGWTYLSGISATCREIVKPRKVIAVVDSETSKVVWLWSGVTGYHTRALRGMPGLADILLPFQLSTSDGL